MQAKHLAVLMVATEPTPARSPIDDAIERLRARLEAWRAIASGHEMIAGSVTGVLSLAAAIDWLK